MRITNYDAKRKRRRQKLYIQSIVIGKTFMFVEWATAATASKLGR